MDKRFLGILGTIVVIFGAIFVITQNSGDKSKNNSSSKSNSQPTSHIEGKGAKKVTLIEYGDYECPVCWSYYQPLKQAVDQLNNDIYFQFRNLPLVSIHKNAFAAARAAEAADLQGKYWQMHDKLYDNQDPQGQTGWVASNNPLTFFKSFAQAIGLDVNKFTTDYSSSIVNDRINADLNTFKATGKDQATPTFFLDGKYVDNATQLIDPNTQAPSAQKIIDLIKAEITKKASA